MTQGVMCWRCLTLVRKTHQCPDCRNCLMCCVCSNDKPKKEGE